MDLPKFEYHPDPIQTGSVIKSNAVCIVCQKITGYIYVGPVYTNEELDDRICPWCIADGSAHQKYDADFTDSAGVGGYGDWDEIEKQIVEIIAFRTPGFNGWQPERWWTHCQDGGEFLGPMGKAELNEFGDQAVKAIREESGLEGEELEEYMEQLDRERGPTAYLFQCRHCKRYGGYSDIH